MTISERISYVKGLADGMKLDTESNEGKLISAIIDILADISEEIDAINEEQFDMADQLDEVDEDLSTLEEIIYDDDEDECECGCGCGPDCDCGCQEGLECTCGGDCDCGCGDDELYEVTCPNCNDVIYLDAEMLDEDGIACPNCVTDLEFEFECDCDCDCDCAEEE